MANILADIVDKEDEGHRHLRSLIFMVHEMIEENYYGNLLVKFEHGSITTIKKEETIKF